MSPVELKNIISKKLLKIDDIVFLHNIHSIIDSKINEDIYILNDEQKSRVEQALNDYKSGKTINEKVVYEELEKWLSIQ